MRKLVSIVALLLTLPASGWAQFNATVTLKIGDPAPAMKAEAWVRGQPLKHFEKGKVYVLDFWATWCGGCISSFPKISAFADKYKDKVVFVAVNTYEQIDDDKVVDPVAKVTEFIKKPAGQKLRLDICVDGNAKTMWDAWIKPLRRSGLPTTFVVDQEGKIAWVDVNLDHLPWVLDQVLAKKWDREKAAAIMHQKDTIDDLMMEAFRRKADNPDKTNQGMLSAADAKAILTAAEAFEKKFPDRTDAVAFYKFLAFMELDRSKIPDLLETMAAHRLSRFINLFDAAGLSLQRKDLTKRDHVAIAKVQERLLLNEFPGAGGQGGKSITAFEELATTYGKAGDPTKATAAIEKAIALAKQEKASTDKIEMLKTSLEKYKSDSSGGK